MSVEAQPLIAVRDVGASSRRYGHLFAADSLRAHEHRDFYDRVYSSSRLILQLHAWEGAVRDPDGYVVVIAGPDGIKSRNEDTSMRLSEAILLGSTVVHPRSGGLHFSRNNEGCALGMAAIAAGCTFRTAPRQIPLRDLRTVNIESVFGPWLLRVVMRPCECKREFPREMRIKDVIAHLFDVHVMEKKNWSVDQLVEWVKRWEPREIDVINQPATASETESEIDEAGWQSAREAFEAKHKSKLRRRPGM